MGTDSQQDDDNLVRFAKSELAIVGLDKPDSDYNGMIAEAVIELVRVFAKQGHSGFSASIVTSLVERLMRFEPLSPLTGEDNEWMECAEGTFQNKRCPHVFKAEGEVYDIDGFVFKEPSGSCFTSFESRRQVTFPYTPKRNYVFVPEDSSSADRLSAIAALTQSTAA